MADDKEKKVRGRPFEKGDKNPKRMTPGKSGRQPGTPNKISVIKAAVLGAFDRVGAEDYLVRLARSRKDRGLFIQLLTKAMPTEVTGANGGPIDVHVFQIARDGLRRLDDTELQEFHRLLVKIGVNEIVAASNDDAAVPLLPPPAQQEARA